MEHSATQRVLAMPELLTSIFRFSTTNANCSTNLLVNKLWSNQVLNIEWRQVDDLFQLITVLAPTVPDRDDLLNFTRPLRPSDWDRFHFYAWRVRSLKYSNEPYTEGFSPSLYLEIAISRPCHPLLPNLRHLTCPPILNVLRVFAHPAVTFLTLASEPWADEEPQIIKSVFLLLPERMPALTDIIIDMPSSTTDIIKFKDGVSYAFGSLTKLRNVALSSHWLSPQLTQKLSRLRDLKTLDSTTPTRIIDTTLLFSDDLASDSFPSLKEMSLFIPFPRAIECINGTCWSRALSSLKLHTIDFVTPQDYRHIIQLIADRCTQLKVLQLITDFGHKGDGDDDAVIRFEDLEPLLSCTLLEGLDLAYTTPFHLRIDDVITILKTLPHLSQLRLNDAPSRAAPPTLHISCLTTIASLFPSLEVLGLYVDTTETPDKAPREITRSFNHLEILSVGTSPLQSNSTIAVALYLSHVLPAQCSLEDFKGWRRLPEANSQTARWEQVRTLIPAFWQALESGKQRCSCKQSSAELGE